RQCHVAIGRIHKCPEVRFQAVSMAAAGYGEVWCIGVAFDVHLAKRAMKTSFGGENSCNAVKDAEVGVLKGVRTRDWGCAAFPGTNLSFGSNFAGRLGISQCSVIVHGVLAA